MKTKISKAVIKRLAYRLAQQEAMKMADEMQSYTDCNGNMQVLRGYAWEMLYHSLLERFCANNTEWLKEMKTR